MTLNKRTIAFFGGTGGLGSQTVDCLSKEYQVDALGRAHIDINDHLKLSTYLQNNKPNVVVFFTNYNYNCFLHKYSTNKEELIKQINTNIVGVTLGISEALAYMREAQFGRIILASSVTVSAPIAGTSVYASCKAYYENLVKVIAMENASKNITANCIQLGYMDGGLTYTLPEDFLKDTINKIPAKRLGSVEEIATTIDFLIKNEYVNGVSLKIAGGL